jgi:hypothetical protein
MIDIAIVVTVLAKAFSINIWFSNSTNKKRSFWVLSLKFEGRIMNIIFTPRRLIEG